MAASVLFHWVSIHHLIITDHRLLLIRVVGNAGGYIWRVGGRNTPWKGHRSLQDTNIVPSHMLQSRHIIYRQLQTS